MAMMIGGYELFTSGAFLKGHDARGHPLRQRDIKKVSYLFSLCDNPEMSYRILNRVMAAMN